MSSILQQDAYAPTLIEPRWQAEWAAAGLYAVDTAANDDRLPFYCLSMFPYPSGRLHMGHVRNYTLGDVVARIKRMQGFNVLQPMGWDSFGLPAENAAIQKGVAPEAWTFENIDYMRGQLQRLGFAYDWQREVMTCREDYYKWTQWLFLQLYKQGLAYKKEAPVNWCPVDQTVLANEQVIEGRCWRDGALVERKRLSQWFFKTTAYADVLLDNLDTLPGWPERVKTMQKRWIERSYGSRVKFIVRRLAQPAAEFGARDGAQGNQGAENDFIEVYTTRPDTLFGVTYLALAPEHALVDKLTTPEQRDAVLAYCEAAKNKPEMERVAEGKAKTGVFTGGYATHPLTGEAIPVWVADYVLAEYGTGAVMAVPAHDSRDFEFANTYGLAVREVISSDGKSAGINSEAYTAYGVLLNSGAFNGLDSESAKTEITKSLDDRGLGARKTQYRLRDWLVSRQRFWGAPIPIIYCPSCGTVPVPEAQLPVKLPAAVDVDFKAKGKSPLASVEHFVNTPCPSCGGPATRETDTMDTFVCSSWYFLRFVDPHNTERPFDPALIAKWLPVDQYVGGIEHAILHLMYARFFMMALADAGLTGSISNQEPFKNLLTQGMVLKDGAKMSKSKGNVVDPDEILKTYGADTARFFILSDSPPQADFDWKDSGVEGCFRFLQKVWRLVVDWQPVLDLTLPEPDLATLSGEQKAVYRATHQAISGISADIENAFQFNTVVSKLRELVNALSAMPKASDAEVCASRSFAVATLIKLLAPICPHMAEALWEKLGMFARTGSIHTQAWPSANPAALVPDALTIVVQFNGKLRAEFTASPDASKADLEASALALPKVQSLLAGQSLVKTIVVPGKLVNFVIKPA
ncbi:MAG: leucine--tRNA ligase [Vampirovibrionales bacterium]|nr:leucine--tRNA ligase [Vampirovibrionales bacterium]